MNISAIKILYALLCLRKRVKSHFNKQTKQMVTKSIQGSAFWKLERTFTFMSIVGSLSVSVLTIWSSYF